MKISTKSFSVISATITFIGVLILSSCNKEAGKGEFQQVMKLENIVAPSPDNPDNPFDEIGALHNLMMVECRENVEGYYNAHGTWSIDAADSIATLILAEHGFFVPAYNLEFITSLLADSESYYINYVSQAGASHAVIEVISSLIGSTKELINTDDPYIHIKECIVEQESEIMSNKNLHKEEVFALLSAASVLRHSLYYWLSYGSFGAEMYLPSKENNKKGRGWRIALADFAGALTGALTGAASGATVGHQVDESGHGAALGATIGAVAGAVGGAVKASCDKATEEAKSAQQSQEPPQPPQQRS